MKKIASVALSALMAASMTVSAFAMQGEATIAGITSLDFQGEGFEPEKGIDGDMETRISIDIDSNDGEYVIAELDQVYSVAGLSISWNNGHTRFYDVEAYVSTDGENWTVAAERTGTEIAAEAKGFSYLAFSDVFEAKYVKLQCWGKTDLSDNVYDGGPDEKGNIQSWFTFWEMKVITEDGLPYPATAGEGEAQIVSLTSQDFQGEGYEPAYGVDGDMDTRISIDIDSNDGKYVIAELKEVSSVTGLSISWNNGHTRFYDVEVYVSTDGENWTVAAERAGTEIAAEAKGFSTLALDKAYDAKYIKINCWGKTDLSDNVYDGGPDEKGNIQSWFTFWELKVLTAEIEEETTAPETEAVTTPETTPATTPAPAETPAAPATMDVSVLLAGAAAASAAVAAVIRKKK